MFSCCRGMVPQHVAAAVRRTALLHTFAVVVFGAQVCRADLPQRLAHILPRMFSAQVGAQFAASLCRTDLPHNLPRRLPHSFAAQL